MPGFTYKRKKIDTSDHDTPLLQNENLLPKTDFSKRSKHEEQDATRFNFKNMYTFQKIFSAVCHFALTITILVFWINISKNSEKNHKLATKCYFTSDFQSWASSVGTKGYLLPSAVSSMFQSQGTTMNNAVQLTTTTIMHLGQPIMLQYDDGDENESMYLSPNHNLCKDITLTNITIDPYRFRACRAGDIPSSLVDVAYPMDTMTIFGTNNMLALIYNTMFITWIMSIAVFSHEKSAIPWAMIAELLLVINLFAMAILPLTNPEANLPLNNVILFAVLHIVCMIYIATTFINVKKKKEKNDEIEPETKKQTTPEPTKTKIYPGKMVANMNVDFFTISVFSNNEAPTDQIANEDAYHDKIYMIINVRFFEYSMTAGLFIVGVMLAFYPTGEIYILQILYQGIIVFTHNLCVMYNILTNFHTHRNVIVQSCCHTTFQGDCFLDTYTTTRYNFHHANWTFLNSCFVISLFRSSNVSAHDCGFSAFRRKWWGSSSSPNGCNECTWHLFLLCNWGWIGNF